MDVDHPDAAIAPIASAIGEPARARMLHALADGRARTATELAVLAGITPSTASVHLQRLTTLRLVKVFAQGRHRYFSLDRPDVARALEALRVLAGDAPRAFVINTPHALRAARTCYDHTAGALGVAVFDRLIALGWISAPDTDGGCDVTPLGTAKLAALGVEIKEARVMRRRFAFACVDWSERRPHLAGALGAAILRWLVQQRWIVRDVGSRILRVTPGGARELSARLGVELAHATNRRSQSA